MSRVKPTNPQINRSHPLARGLVGAWAFEDGGGSVLRDVSGHGLNGTLTNMEATDWVGSEYGGALDFDAADDYVQCPTHSLFDCIDYDRHWSVSAWVRWDGGASKMVWGKATETVYKGAYTYANTGGELSFSVNNNFGTGNRLFVTTDLALTSGQWAHVVWVYRGVAGVTNTETAMSVYIDGVEASLTLNYGPGVSASANDGTFQIGARAANASYLWDGSISDLRLWSRSLSANEIAASFARPFDLYSPAVGTQERYYRGNAPIGAVGTGLHAIEAGGVYGAPGINSGLHAIGTGVVTA
jgi:hypothetical protein